MVSVRMPGCDGRASLPSSRIVNRPSRPRILRLMSVVKVAAVKVVDAKSASAASVRDPFPLEDRVAAVTAADPEAGPAPETTAENATTPANAAAAARVRAGRRRRCIAIVLSSTACRSLRYRRAMRSRGVRGHRTRAMKSDNLPKVPIRRGRHVAAAALGQKPVAADIPIDRLPLETDSLVVGTGDGQDPRRRHPGEAGSPEPGPGGRLRLRVRGGPGERHQLTARANGKG